MHRSKVDGRQAVAAAVVGNILEWYDFAVYAYLAGVIGKNFFPSNNEVTSLLATFVVFGVGFVVRPLGGIVIGWIGDIKGRKTALLLTIFLMAIGTVTIGLLPTYGAIGVLAPALIVIARLMQGFSAGGEWGGSTAFIVEWAPSDRRGVYGSFQQASVAAGLLLGSGVAALINSLMTPGDLESFGWRIPFLLGGLIAPIGLYMRRNIDETPAFRQTRAIEASKSKELSPLPLALRAFGFTILWTVSYYMMLAYMPTFTQKYAGLSRTAALWSNTAGLLVLVATVPLMGYLSDKLGRKPLLIACCVGFIILSYPLFALMLSGVGLQVIVAVQILFGLMIALFSGPGPAAIAEIFPTRSRSTWMSTGYSIAVAVFGGFAPTIATLLIDRTGSPLAPTGYLVAAAIVSALVIVRLPETAHDNLR